LGYCKTKYYSAKNYMLTATHGIAMGSPCVGPQERPKGE
jgi:hypothetical protein